MLACKCKALLDHVHHIGSLCWNPYWNSQGWWSQMRYKEWGQHLPTHQTDCRSCWSWWLCWDTGGCSWCQQECWARRGALWALLCRWHLLQKRWGKIVCICDKRRKSEGVNNNTYVLLSVDNECTLTKDCKVGEMVAVASHNTFIHFWQISLTTICCPLCVHKIWTVAIEHYVTICELLVL